jgi:hypothetical protein
MGKKAFLGAVSLAVAAAALLLVATDASAPALAVASLLGLVVLAFALYVGAWARNALAWRRERPVTGKAPKAEPQRPADVGLELGS